MESREQIEQAAADWIARRDKGQWTVNDDEALERWVGESTAHLVAFTRLEAAWAEANRLKAVGAGVARGARPSAGELRASPYYPKVAVSDAVALGSEPATSESRTAPGASRSRWYVAAAAALVMAVAFSVWRSGMLARNAYSTPIGGFASVPMADGSMMTLNTDSRVRVALSQKERRVELERGEAFFEVAKDPVRPFVVHAGDRRVTAVGTKFSVLRGEHDFRVVVTEGQVRVEGGLKESPRLLGAGGVARARDAQVVVRQEAMPQVEEALSWRRGYVVFHETPLAEAAAEFNRYNARKIVIADAAAAAIRIGGNFKPTNVEAFVRLVRNGFPVRVEEEGDRIVVRRE